MLTDDGKIILAGALVISFLIITWVGVLEFAKYDCRVQAEIMEVDYKFHWWAGCFYKETGRWVKNIQQSAEAQKIYIKGE